MGPKSRQPVFWVLRLSVYVCVRLLRCSYERRLGSIIAFAIFSKCCHLTVRNICLRPQNKLKSTHKEKVRKFIALTQTGEQTAICCLTHNEWKLDLACDNYFQAPGQYYRELDRQKVEQLYAGYRDPSDPGKITSDGVMRFLDDLRLSPESQLVLIIAWKFRAETQCEFTRDEFINGFLELGVDSLEKLGTKLPTLETDLSDLSKFKDFYQFTFNYAKEAGQKGLDLEMAIAYWNIVMKGRFKFLDLWCKFLVVGVVDSIDINH